MISRNNTILCIFGSHFGYWRRVFRSMGRTEEFSLWTEACGTWLGHENVKAIIFIILMKSSWDHGMVLGSQVPQKSGLNRSANERPTPQDVLLGYFEFSICVFRNIWYCVYIAAGEWTESPTNQKRVSCVTGLPARTKHRSCRLFLLATICPLTGGPEACLE